MEGVELEVRDDALNAVSRQAAMERKTGARGLRSILEGMPARHHVRPAVTGEREEGGGRGER